MTTAVTSGWHRSVTDIVVSSGINNDSYKDYLVAISMIVGPEDPYALYQLAWLGDDPDVEFQGQAVFLGDVMGLEGEVPNWICPQHVRYL